MAIIITVKNVFLSALLVAFVQGNRGFIRKSDFGASNWISVQQNVEFLAAAEADLKLLEDSALRRQLESSTERNFYNSHSFVDGEAEYDEYQQAWRYLGFMIDCSGDDDDDDGGSWEGTGEGCHRYLLWAAYVDLDYSGGGIGEYQYWDRKRQEWDDTPCNYRQEGSGDGGSGSNDNNNEYYEDGNRCAKMDCHLEDTHWSLLGFFKHKSYDDWMEQLFKHEGMCVWSDEEYAFMKNARKGWPQGCAASSTTASDGSTIYYDVKPTGGGGMSVGLYTDTQCMDEYKRSGWNDPVSVENVLGNFLLEGGSGDSGDNGDYDFSSFSLEDAYNFWDSAFDEWKICHPCVAYDINNVGYNTDDDASKGSSYMTYTYGYDDDQYAAGGADFDCYDDAGYTNVNQCMKFMAKTEMLAATFQDLSLASTQGTMVGYVPVEGYKDRSKTGGAESLWFTTIFFIVSMAVLAGGIYVFAKTRKEMKDFPQFMRRPLVFA